MVDEKLVFRYFFEKGVANEDDFKKHFEDTDCFSLITKKIPLFQQLGMNIILVRDENDTRHLVLTLPGTMPRLSNQELELLLFLTYMRKKKGKLTFDESKARLSDYSRTLQDLVDNHALFTISEDGMLLPTPKCIAILAPISSELVEFMDEALGFESWKG